MGKDSKRRIPVENAATIADLASAQESMSATDLLRLKSFARYLVRGLGRAARGGSYKDLLQDAYVSTAEGARGGDRGRRWDKSKTTLTNHLLGAMRSIASHWDESFDDEEWSDSDAARQGNNGELVRPVENAATSAPSQYRSCLAKEQLAEIDETLAGKEDAQLILLGWDEGMTGPEMIEHLGLTQKRVDAAIKLIRYHVKGSDRA